MTSRERVTSPLRSTPGAAPSLPEPEPEVPRAPDGGPADPLPLRELTGWEEEFLGRREHEPNTARVCNEVLALCCAPPGEDPGDAVRAQVRRLLVADRDRELVRLRTMSLGPRIEGEVACPACGEVNRTTFSLDDLDLDVPAVANRERVTLEDGSTVELRLPTAGDQEDLLEAGIDSPAQRRSWLLARCVLELDGAPVDLAAARAMPMRTRTLVEQLIEDRVPALDLEMALHCVHCAEDFTAPFDVAVFFFRHDRCIRAAGPGRAPVGALLPLVGAPDLEPAAAPAHRLPDAAGGRRRRRAAGRPDRRRGDRPGRVRCPVAADARRTGAGPAAGAHPRVAA